MSYRISKRLLDLAVVLIAAPIAIPLVVLGATASALAHRSNPFFIQLRTGQNGKPLNVFKLKTMHDAEDRDDTLVDDATRLTSTGRFLRKTSIDELPQLWNVLVGNMSIVGPRPHIRRYAAMMTPEEFRRHDAKPGITGWAQINGRNALTWSERFQLDVWYVENANFWLDVKIVLKTPIYILKGDGVSDGKSVTMTPLDLERSSTRDAA